MAAFWFAVMIALLLIAAAFAFPFDGSDDDRDDF